MGTWNSRGLRGSTLEDLVNHTNEYYLERGLALIQKIPTPITPVKICLLYTSPKPGRSRRTNGTVLVENKFWRSGKLLDGA